METATLEVAVGGVVNGEVMSRGRGKAMEAVLSTERGQCCWRRIGGDVVVSRRRRRLLNIVESVDGSVVRFDDDVQDGARIAVGVGVALAIDNGHFDFEV